MQIQIIDIKQVAHPTRTPGKTTPKLDIAYKNLSFGNKIEGKALFSFGSSEAAFKVLAEARQNDIYTIERKKEGEYQNWVDAKKSDASEVLTDTSTATTSSATAKSYSTGSKSTYPSDEERAKTQVYIVRQSNLAQAINLLSVGAKSPPKVEDVIKIAKEFEGHVFGDSKTEVVKPAVKMDEQMGIPEDDIPF